MTFKVRCPRCQHFMMYNPIRPGKRMIKKCVYCGRSFTVNRDTIHSRIK